MIVRGDTCLLELAGLFVAELAEGDTDFHPELADLADGFEHGVEAAVARLHPFPCGTHAEARGAALPGLFGHGEDVIAGHEFPGLDSGIVAGALGAVGAILATPSGFHTQQRTELNIVLIPVLQMNGARTLEEVEERGAVDFLDLGNGDGMSAHDS